MKDIADWTREEFEALPFRERWDSADAPWDQLVLLPGNDLHDSGWRNMDVVGVRNGVPICRLAGGSDVINFEGIGGRRLLRQLRELPRVGHVDPDHEPQWQIDCLPVSGLLRLWNDAGAVLVGHAISSLEIFGVPKPVAVDKATSG